jgi:hypothetical protein
MPEVIECKTVQVIIPEFKGFIYIGYKFPIKGEYYLRYGSTGRPELSIYNFSEESNFKSFVYGKIDKPEPEMKVLIENAPGYAIEDILEMKPSIVLFTNEKVRHGMYSLGYYDESRNCYYWGKHEVPLDCYLKGYIVKK